MTEKLECRHCKGDHILFDCPDFENFDWGDAMTERDTNE